MSPAVSRSTDFSTNPLPSLTPLLQEHVSPLGVIGKPGFWDRLLVTHSRRVRHQLILASPLRGSNRTIGRWIGGAVYLRLAYLAGLSGTQSSPHFAPLRLRKLKPEIRILPIVRPNAVQYNTAPLAADRAGIGRGT